MNKMIWRLNFFHIEEKQEKESKNNKSVLKVYVLLLRRSNLDNQKSIQFKTE